MVVSVDYNDNNNNNNKNNDNNNDDDQTTRGAQHCYLIFFQFT